MIRGRATFGSGCIIGCTEETQIRAEVKLSELVNAHMNRYTNEYFIHQEFYDPSEVDEKDVECKVDSPSKVSCKETCNACYASRRRRWCDQAYTNSPVIKSPR